MNEARARRELRIRPIERRDDPDVARIIRAVMTEFGASGPGCAIHDPEVVGMFDAYRPPRAGYCVVVRGQGGQVVGGGGFAALARGAEGVCELRKMYLLPEARGVGMGRELLTHLLEAARQSGYHTSYLETLKSMAQARRLYEAFGFEPASGPLGETGHFGCDAWYVKRLR